MDFLSPVQFGPCRRNFYAYCISISTSGNVTFLHARLPWITVRGARPALYLCNICIHYTELLRILRCASSIPYQDRIMFSCKHLEENECKTPSGFSLITSLYLTLHYVFHLDYVTLKYITLHYITWHDMTLYCIRIDHIRFRCMRLDYIALHWFRFHCVRLHKLH